MLAARKFAVLQALCILGLAIGLHGFGVPENPTQDAWIDEQPVGAASNDRRMELDDQFASAIDHGQLRRTVDETSNDWKQSFQDEGQLESDPVVTDRRAETNRYEAEKALVEQQQETVPDNPIPDAWLDEEPVGAASKDRRMELDDQFASAPDPGQLRRTVGETASDWKQTFLDQGQLESNPVASDKRTETNRYEAEIKGLKALVEQQQEAQQTLMQQVDALVRQESETRQLIGAKTNSDGLNVGTRSTGISAKSLITTGGTHYVRWGRNDCPSGRQELYKGYTAGNTYTSKTGGVNMLCVHESPQWGSSGSSSGSYLAGAEYQFSSTPFSTSNNGGQTLKSQDPPCVVCHTPLRSSQLMIPSRRFCPTGWTFEYRGYLVSTNYGYAYSDFVCLDETPGTRVGGQRSAGGLYLYPVRASCSYALPCPEYVQSRPITCVVCTK